MDHSNGFPPPDPTTLLAEADALCARPGFDAAARAFCDGMIAFHAGRWALIASMGYALGFAVSALTIHLDAAWPGGATAARLSRICQAGHLAGPKAVKGAIDIFRNVGLIDTAPDPCDRRARRLRPTPALLALMQDNLAMRLAVQEALTPFPEPAALWARREGVVEAFLGGTAGAFSGSGFRLDRDFPEVRDFIDRQCGYLVLLALTSAELADVGQSNLCTLSAMADRFNVSRAHVRKLLAFGRDQGWLTAHDDRATPRLVPPTRERLRRWIGLEFAWTARLVAPPIPAE